MKSVFSTVSVQTTQESIKKYQTKYKNKDNVGKTEQKQKKYGFINDNLPPYLNGTKNKSY